MATSLFSLKFSHAETKKSPAWQGFESNKYQNKHQAEFFLALDFFFLAAFFAAFGASAAGLLEGAAEGVAAGAGAGAAGMTGAVGAGV